MATPNSRTAQVSREDQKLLAETKKKEQENKKKAEKEAKDTARNERFEAYKLKRERRNIILYPILGLAAIGLGVLLWLVVAAEPQLFKNIAVFVLIGSMLAATLCMLPTIIGYMGQHPWRILLTLAAVVGTICYLA